MSKSAALIVIALVYLGAGLVCAWVYPQLEEESPLLIALALDGLATLLVFAASISCRNASVYDPYWSVAPLVILFYWYLAPGGAAEVPLRSLLVLALMSVWGARLTWNWALRWRGFSDEDWRYQQLRDQHRGRYWMVNLGGIHLLPTLLVFLGLLPAWPALVDSARGFNLLDVIAGALLAGGIWVEARADRELRRFIKDRKPGEFLHTGLWARCRHPNYLGELMVWWGLFLFGLAANPAWWWTVTGPIAMTALFLFISIPMMESRKRKRYGASWERAQATPKLIPRVSGINGP